MPPLDGQEERLGAQAVSMTLQWSTFYCVYFARVGVNLCSPRVYGGDVISLSLYIICDNTARYSIQSYLKRYLLCKCVECSLR